MKFIFSLLVLSTSISVFAETIVPTKGKELHLNCVLNFEPFFVEISSNHEKAKLSLNNRIDSEGRGQSREFITDLKLIETRESNDTKEMYFKGLARNRNVRGLLLTIPHYMDLYFGSSNQPARIDTFEGTELPGSCYVQFPAMPPQW